MESLLLERCRKICGMTMLQVANTLDSVLPKNSIYRKGWVGLAVEKLLGANAGSKAIPDFPYLGIELKTIPLDKMKKPLESTFVTSISFKQLQGETWENSQCYSKLRRILWVSIEAQPQIPFLQRRIGEAFLWSPTTEDLKILKNDWELLTGFIIRGELAQLNASFGEYLQVRPKGANSKALSTAFDEDGNSIKTLSRGFYLRSLFTKKIIADRMSL